MILILSVFIKLILAGGLINVWVLRNSKSTAYRGGRAQNLRQEFETYGLSKEIYYIIGFLKISSAFGLILSFWIPYLTLYFASLVALLMLGAVSMHIKIKDPVKKCLPALFMLLMSVCLLFLSWP